MLESLITSKTRLRLLIKFFINIANKGYLNSLANEFGESTNSVRKELNNLTQANYLTKKIIKNKVIYKANDKHPLYSELQTIVKKYLGIEKMIEAVLEKMGELDQIFLLGDYAKGIDSEQIDILITGQKLNIEYISGLENKLNKLLNKKVVISTKSVVYHFGSITVGKDAYSGANNPNKLYFEKKWNKKWKTKSNDLFIFDSNNIIEKYIPNSKTVNYMLSNANKINGIILRNR